jgi:hypothetical protein
MLSIKCPNCGQRILNPEGLLTCPNCGAPLIPQIMGPAGEHSSSYERQPFAGMVVDSASPGFSSNDGAHGAHIHTDDTSPLPTFSPGAQGHRFPRGLPRRPPDLQGTIILVDAHEEPKRAGGVSNMLSTMLLDLIWSIPGGTSSQLNKEKERVQVTRIRIRTQDGAQKDARLEGRLTAVHLAQGDQVSLWGKQKSGLLLFQHGYNHTTQGIIKTSNMSSSSGTLLLFVVIFGILMFIYFYSSSHSALHPHIP